MLNPIPALPRRGPLLPRRRWRFGVHWPPDGMAWPCTHCSTGFDPDYKPAHCCGGSIYDACGCMGLPINDPMCTECVAKLDDGQDAEAWLWSWDRGLQMHVLLRRRETWWWDLPRVHVNFSEDVHTDDRDSP